MVATARLSPKCEHAALATVLLVFLVAPPSMANPTFRAPALLIDTRGYPTSAVAADLNGDGRPDLVSTSAGYPDMFGKVSVALGNGDGTFGAWTHFDTGSWPYSVAVGDIDEDGDLDLVTANADWYGRENGSLSILLGNGDGTFAPRTDLDAGRNVRVAIVDLDADGHLDLVTDRSMLLGNGDGTFRAPVSQWVGPFALADFNGDGRLDLVRSTNGDAQDELPAAYVRLGNGDGTFGEEHGFGVGANTGDVAVGDVNRDGRTDIAVTETQDFAHHVTVLLGNGDGTFGAQRGYPTGWDPFAVAVADLNGDGFGDVVTANYGFDPQRDSNSLTVQLGSGDGTFHTTPDLYVGVNPRSLTVADFNGDGVPDLATADEDVPGTISVVLGNGDGTFGPPRLATAGRPWAVAIGDLDNDGRQDLVVGQDGSTAASVFLDTGEGTFGPRTESDFGSMQSYVAIADLDGDGRLDLVATDWWSGARVKLGTGDGTFGPATAYATGNGTTSVTVADLNEDRAPDLLVTNGNDHSISMLPGIGNGTFGTSRIVASGFGFGRLAVADLDRDGHLDLAISNGTILLGHGDGTFTTGTTNPGFGYLAIGDLDGDGIPDIAGSTGSTWLGNGDGTFRHGSTFDPGFSPSSLVMGDFNADGKLDVAISNENVASGVTALLGNGDGSFGKRMRFGVGQGTPALAIGDLNGDGRADLACADFASRSVSLLMGSGSPSAPLKPRYAPGRRPFGDGNIAAEGAGDRNEPGGGGSPTAIRRALEGFRPNPAFGVPVVAFTLANDSPATIEVIDLAGRSVVRREVGALGAGRHAVSLGSSAHLAPGAYVMRLRQAGRTLTARGVVVR
jgi:VCBS repeat protein/FG-GAP repeat protein